MSIIVSKFGGSSIADANQFRQVRRILASRSVRRYIILSAPGKRDLHDDKITDLLCSAHALYASGQDGSAPLQEVRNRFTAIARELSLNVDIEALLADLESDVRHSADRAASRGEYLCARMFSVYADIPFVDATELIRFDENGRIQPDEIRRRVRAMADRLYCAVIPGFYGVLPNGEIRTFSRGGSDITGALVAAALEADIYENWTDVDGLMSIDPASCPDAVCHAAVSYRQMRLLARAGAQVLHPYCLEPVCEAGIPTMLRNTFAPEQPGTYISDHVRTFVPCVCIRRGFQAVEIADLGDEARSIVNGLPVQRYLSSDSREMLVLQPVKGFQGRPANIVSAFGLPSARRTEAMQRVDPIAVQHLDHVSEFVVSPEQSRKAMCILHELILSGTTKASRTRSSSFAPCHLPQ
ncbi:MAG: hypothetical protein ACI4MF_02510 [Candidatus Faecivicinus sp.]